MAVDNRFTFELELELKHGTAYVDAGQEYYEERYRIRVVQNLKRKVNEMGFVLVEAAGLQPKNATS